jgi:hypothetical protein
VISEITVKITLGQQANAMAEGSTGYVMKAVIPYPPGPLESSITAPYAVPPVPEFVEESNGKFAEIPAPENEQARSESGQIAPPQELQSVFEEEIPASPTKVRFLDEIAPPE